MDRKREILSLTLAGLVGQVGCVTLVIVLLVIFLGMWLDRVFQTRPIITLILVFGSIPVSIFMMLFLVRKGVNRIKDNMDGPAETHTQEDPFDRS